MEIQLMALFSNMWNNNVVPAAMSKVRVAYIHKGKDPLPEISGYRPISLISCIGKMFTLMWLKPLTEAVAEKVGPMQGAFRKGTGATEQAWLLIELAYEQLDKLDSDPHVMLTDLKEVLRWDLERRTLLHSGIDGSQGPNAENIRA